MVYQVDLESFHGPLDLLLYLVKRSEVDVRDIPVAKVAEQFLEYLNAIQIIDVEWAGDFLVTAATLLEVKSRMLLPRVEGSSTEPTDDPRKELVKQLIEYRKTKESAGHLERLAEERQFQTARVPPDDEEGATSPRLRRVELWDLVSAFARLVRETQALQPQHIVADETSQADYQDLVREKLSHGDSMPFRDLFDPPHYKTRLIGLFLAVLELMKQLEIELEQAEPFGEIWVRATATTS